MDIWVLQYEYYNESKANAWNSNPGKQHWLYHCIEPSDIQFLNTFIERPLIQV